MGCDQESSVEEQKIPKLISFCIPTYNRAKYLRRTLESMLSQVGPDVELVISDNGSTDDTHALVRRYQQIFPHLLYVRNGANLGYDLNLLRCLKLARAEYVWFFGSDDLLNEGAVETVRRRIREARTRPALVYLNHQVVDNQGTLLIANQIGREEDGEFPSGSACVARLGLHLGYMSALVLRRQDCLLQAADTECVGSGWIHLHLVLGCLRAGGAIAYVGRPLVRARRSVSLDYDLTDRFVQGANRVFWRARRHGYRWFTIYRAMNHTVRSHFVPVVLAWRCDNPRELERFFLALLRDCWMYPWFWLLAVPGRFIPRWLAVTLRQGVRWLRARRNRRPGSLVATPTRRNAGLAP